MTRVIVLGSTGMLGHQVVKAIQPDLVINSRDYDFAHHRAVGWFVRDIALSSDDIVVNCCGLLRQHLPEAPTAEDCRRAFLLNAYLPQYLADRCRLIHVSTDCLWSGKDRHGRPYTEIDRPDGEDLYARTKMLGEPSKAMVIRTSIVGRELKNHKGLMDWFLRQRKAKGFTNHLWNGLTTTELARCIKLVLENGWYQIGLFHLFGQTVRKYDILAEINKHRRDPAVLTPVEAPEPIERTLATVRPEFLGRFGIRPFAEQIAEAMRT
jgi:dTDP-4-dehydrorhamnose reductase